MNLEINNKKIILDHNPKFLGIYFDPKVSFTHHFNNTEISIQKRINIIRILKSKHWSSSKEFLLNFYKTYRLRKFPIHYSESVHKRQTANKAK